MLLQHFLGRVMHHAHQMRIRPDTYIYGDEIFEGLTHLQTLDM